eukprot:1733431-Amphidinium_carterae.2
MDDNSHNAHLPHTVDKAEWNVRKLFVNEHLLPATMSLTLPFASQCEGALVKEGQDRPKDLGNDLMNVLAIIIRQRPTKDLDEYAASHTAG